MILVLFWIITQISENNTERFERIVPKTLRRNEIVWQHESRIWMHGSKIPSLLQEYARINSESLQAFFLNFKE
jgi:hypothetical protein